MTDSAKGAWEWAPLSQGRQTHGSSHAAHRPAARPARKVARIQPGLGTAQQHAGGQDVGLRPANRQQPARYDGGYQCQASQHDQHTSIAAQLKAARALCAGCRAILTGRMLDVY